MIAILLMVAAGGAIAVFVLAAMTIATKEQEHLRQRDAIPSAERDRIAASLLFHVVAAGGVSPDQAMRAVRRGAGIAAPVTTGIDVTNWADNYARITTPQQRAGLLETAVQLAASRGNPIPLRQYAALLDLSFGLGFHSDALAKLREVYRFDYVDHAKDARPRHADRAGGGAPLFVRETRGRDDLLQVLGITGTPTRQELTAAYRRLVAQHHPDKFHDAPPQAQSDAAARFIEITRAYEELLLLYRE
ncbi:MAG TPA: J domain-containing protein [Thermoanaerobaculia bacterium]|nr:J domain-containing protein [Thermoanaerobaculia bacterium]